MYKCQKCRYNNNGWCNIKRINGLKKKNIQECENYKINGQELIIRRDFDGLGAEHLTIELDENECFIPEKILEDFIKNKDLKSIKIDIPN